ncbi:hypothetical protein GQ457_16G019310 [Hibiscus cannabinus]
MTRANPWSPIYALDPEIKRPRRELRQRARRLMAHRENNGHNPIEEQEPPTPAIRQQPPAPTEMLLFPPAPQNNQQPFRTIKDYLEEDLKGLNPVVIISEFEAEHFDLKPVMFNILNTLGQLDRSPAENARQHC